MSHKYFPLIHFIFIIFFISVPGYSSPNQVYLICRFDDYGIDDFRMYDPMFKIFDKNRIPLVVGVVPFHYDMKVDSIVNLDSTKIFFLKKYLSSNNIEIAQHGYAHINNYETKIHSEFYDVDYAKQLDQIKRGKLLLQKQFNVDIDTFIPPWNSYDSNTVKVLENLEFKNLSAATYGKIQAVPDKINYIPYTALPTEMDKIKSIINMLGTQNDGKAFLIVILMHTDNFINSGFHTDSRDYSTPARTNQISIAELDQSLSWIKKIKNVRFVTFKELPNFIKKLDSNRLESNIYFEDMIPVFWLSNFRNIYYLDKNEFNLNKYLRLFYQIFYYPVLFIVLTLIITFLMKKIRIIKIKNPRNIILFTLGLLILSIITILTLQLIRPKYLLIITFLLSFTYSVVMRRKANMSHILK